MASSYTNKSHQQQKNILFNKPFQIKNYTACISMEPLTSRRCSSFMLTLVDFLRLKVLKPDFLVRRHSESCGFLISYNLLNVPSVHFSSLEFFFVYYDLSFLPSFLARVFRYSLKENLKSQFLAI